MSTDKTSDSNDSPVNFEKVSLLFTFIIFFYFFIFLFIFYFDVPS